MEFPRLELYFICKNYVNYQYTLPSLSFVESSYHSVAMANQKRPVTADGDPGNGSLAEERPFTCDSLQEGLVFWKSRGKYLKPPGRAYQVEK